MKRLLFPDESKRQRIEWKNFVCWRNVCERSRQRRLSCQCDELGARDVRAASRNLEGWDSFVLVRGIREVVSRLTISRRKLEAVLARPASFLFGIFMIPVLSYMLPNCEDMKKMDSESTKTFSMWNAMNKNENNSAPRVILHRTIGRT